MNPIKRLRMKAGVSLFKLAKKPYGENVIAHGVNSRLAEKERVASIGASKSREIASRQMAVNLDALEHFENPSDAVRFLDMFLKEAEDHSWKRNQHETIARQNAKKAKRGKLIRRIAKPIARAIAGRK